MILDYPGGLNVITRVLTRGRLEGEDQRRRCDHGKRSWRDVGTRAKEGGQPLEARKGKKMGSLLEPPGGMHPCQPILGFQPPEL